MEIKITKDMEKVLTLSEVPAVESLRKAMEEQEDFKWEVERMVALAAGNASLEVLKSDVRIAKNHRIWNYYSGSDLENPTWDIDVWITVMAFDAYYGFYDIGAYLSDIWSIRSDNEDEIKSHMYIRHYVEAGKG